MVLCLFCAYIYKKEVVFAAFSFISHSEHIRNTFGSLSSHIRVSFGLPKNSINMQKGTNEESPLVPSLLIFNY